MKQITIRWSKEGWLADFHHDEGIRKLFGGTVLPTAFTAQAPAAKVLASIQALNPSCKVSIGEAA